ncbi:MAG: hypothetical protein Q7J65_08915 [Candidatus Marinimicrobia bacterium]|nr:hypothetical protein [Candidatus Neomarinimicrobiota bacterium]
MAKGNLVSIQIPAEEQGAIRAALTTLEEKLQPFLIALTKDEKKGLPKMRDKSIRKFSNQREDKKELT